MVSWITIVHKSISRSKRLALVARHDLPNKHRYRIELEIDCEKWEQPTTFLPISDVFIKMLLLETPKQGLFIDEGDRSITIFSRGSTKLIFYCHDDDYTLFRLKKEEIEEFQNLLRVKGFLEIGISQEELANAVKMYLQLTLKSNHENGNCSCLDVLKSHPCTLSKKRSIQERSIDLTETYGTDQISRNFCNFVNQRLDTDILINNYVYENVKDTAYSIIKMIAKEIYGK